MPVFMVCALALNALPACGSSRSSGTTASDAGSRGDSAGSTSEGGADASSASEAAADVGSSESAPDASSPESGPDAGADGSLGGTDSASSASYQGPCDVLTGGCAEAYSVARSMRASYAGPLFQLGRISDNATLDVGQTSAHAADMTTWSAFCGGAQSSCVVSKIYAQVHTGGVNDLVPSVFRAPGGGPNCSAGGFTCAARFTIDASTSLPILTTVAPEEYTLSNDDLAVGVNGGSGPISVVYNGKPIATTTYCCGVFGLTHHYNAVDKFGTDFMVALGYGFDDPPNGSGVNINCGTASTYCAGAEEESENDLADYGSSPLENVILLTEFDPSTNAVSSYLNGKQLFSHSPPTADVNAGTAIHLGGGGDLSQPDPVLMREGLITNTAATSSDAAALKVNVAAFYSTLTFP